MKLFALYGVIDFECNDVIAIFDSEEKALAAKAINEEAVKKDVEEMKFELFDYHYFKVAEYELNKFEVR